MSLASFKLRQGNLSQRLKIKGNLLANDLRVAVFELRHEQILVEDGLDWSRSIWNKLLEVSWVSEATHTKETEMHFEFLGKKTVWIKKSQLQVEMEKQKSLVF